MGFDNKSDKGGRPTTFWNNTDATLNRILTPLHGHEFGMGYDIQYKDAAGKVQARMDGLTIQEANYLRSIKGKF